MKPIALINTKHGTLILDGREWKAEDPELVRLANMIAPAASYRPEQGDFRVAMLDRIRKRIGGEIVIRGKPADDPDVVY